MDGIEAPTVLCPGMRAQASHRVPSIAQGLPCRAAAIWLIWSLTLGLAGAGPASASAPADLITAAEQNELPAVQRFLHSGADVNGHDADGRTALLAATARNHVEIAAILIEAGADGNALDNRLDSPLLLAGPAGTWRSFVWPCRPAPIVRFTIATAGPP